MLPQTHKIEAKIHAFYFSIKNLVFLNRIKHNKKADKIKFTHFLFL